MKRLKKDFIEEQKYILTHFNHIDPNWMLISGCSFCNWIIKETRKLLIAVGMDEIWIACLGEIAWTPSSKIWKLFVT